MRVKLELITGFLIGFEIVWEYEAAMIDLGVIRIFIDWGDENA